MCVPQQHVYMYAHACKPEDKLSSWVSDWPEYCQLDEASLSASPRSLFSPHTLPMLGIIGVQYYPSCFICILGWNLALCLCKANHFID